MTVDLVLSSFLRTLKKHLPFHEFHGRSSNPESLELRANQSYLTAMRDSRRDGMRLTKQDRKEIAGLWIQAAMLREPRISRMIDLNFDPSCLRDLAMAAYVWVQGLNRFMFLDDIQDLRFGIESLFSMDKVLTTIPNHKIREENLRKIFILAPLTCGTEVSKQVVMDTTSITTILTDLKWQSDRELDDSTLWLINILRDVSPETGKLLLEIYQGL